ncbi:MAG TPA: penicillin-binding protein 2 [Thermoleophilaceae bacterium]|nr:penicillin-binding protein 2 [Thermoleophilaceae bacterium]
MRLVERRIGMLWGLVLLSLLLVLVRATWLGTVRADDLKERALTQQEEEITAPARRGVITDRHGVELAVSEDAITVYANPFLIKQPVPLARRLAPLLGVPEAEVLEKLADRDTGFVYLARKLDSRRGEEIEALEVEGIGTVVEPIRRYPQGFFASQVLGFVGTDNKGLSGLEHAHDETLRGSDGKSRIVKDALGKPVSLVQIERAQPGEDLRLTIDSAIQERTEAVLADVGATYRPKGATAVVLDPRNGEVLALANWPRVDANDIGGAPEYARQNRAIEATYEPGSTFKAFTVAGALSQRLVTPSSRFDLPPQIQVADRTIGEAHDRGGLNLTVSEILAQSSNVGSVKIGLLLGKERFDDWVRRFGFGKPTGVGLPGEGSGIVLDPEDYSGSSMGNLPIGQGIAVTPMQMAAAYSAIANRGILHPPRIVAGRGRPPRRVLAAASAEQVSKMLEGVLATGGTAEEAAVEGYTLAGKTGTAEKVDPETGTYSDSKYVASFIGFAPAEDPRLLVAVMVDEPQGAIYGGVVAAPAFEKIVSFALPYMRIPPR